MILTVPVAGSSVQIPTTLTSAISCSYVLHAIDIAVGTEADTEFFAAAITLRFGILTFNLCSAPPGTYIFTLWLTVFCMRSKALLAALQSFSRTLRSQNHNYFYMGPNLGYSAVPSSVSMTSFLDTVCCDKDGCVITLNCMQ